MRTYTLHAHLVRTHRIHIFPLAIFDPQGTRALMCLLCRKSGRPNGTWVSDATLGRRWNFVGPTRKPPAIGWLWWAIQKNNSPILVDLNKTIISTKVGFNHHLATNTVIRVFINQHLLQKVNLNNRTADSTRETRDRTNWELGTSPAHRSSHLFFLHLVNSWNVSTSVFFIWKNTSVIQQIVCCHGGHKNNFLSKHSVNFFWSCSPFQQVDRDLLFSIRSVCPLQKTNDIICSNHSLCLLNQPFLIWLVRNPLHEQLMSLEAMNRT